MNLEPIRIQGADDAYPLASLRYIPDSNPKQIGIVLAHGFTSGKYSMDSLAAYLCERGFECVTFDAVGHKLGCTGGEMLCIDQAADNMRQAIAWMRANLPVARIAVVGHSMGAAAAIHTAACEQANPPAAMPLCGIVCLCMGVDPTAGFESSLGAAMLKQRGDYVRGAPAKDLLSGLNGMLDRAGKIGPLPTLLVGARNDVLLPVRNVEILGERLGATAEVRIIEAMHLDAPDKSRGIVIRWLEMLGAGNLAIR